MYFQCWDRSFGIKCCYPLCALWHQSRKDTVAVLQWKYFGFVCIYETFLPSLCTYLPDHRDAVYQLSLCSLSVQGSNANFGISLMTDGINAISGLSSVALTGFPCLSDSCVVEAEPVDVAVEWRVWDPVAMSCCLSLHGVGLGSAVDVLVSELGNGVTSGCPWISHPSAIAFCFHNPWGWDRPRLQPHGLMLGCKPASSAFCFWGLMTGKMHFWEGLIQMVWEGGAACAWCGSESVQSHLVFQLLCQRRFFEVLIWM